jgi:signal transduction histidine kinase
LTNVQKHSGSTTAQIIMSRSDKEVVLEITDRGKGVPAEILEKGSQDWMGSLGVGLRGMSERLRQLEGTLEISSDEKGTRIRASLPVQRLQPKPPALASIDRSQT